MKDSATGAWCALWSGVKVSGWTPAALLIVILLALLAINRGAVFGAPLELAATTQNTGAESLRL